MTTARHRSAAAAAHRPEGPALRGRAPGGMWWVAWRQHRMQIVVTLALIAILIAGLIILREAIVATFAAAGCDVAARSCTDDAINDLWREHGFGTWSPLLHNAVLLAPVVLGVFVGAPIFPREFSRGAQVFALTQSVSRRRWWTSKVIVAGVPLITGLVALGFVTGWVDGTTAYTAHAGFGTNQFMERAIIPAAHGLAAYGIAVTTGILTRSTVAALVTGLIVAGLAVAGMSFVKLDVLPSTRQITPIEAAIQGNTASPLGTDLDAAYLDDGYLDAAGNEMPRDSLHSCYQRASDAGNNAVGIADSGGSDGSTSGDGDSMSPEEYRAQNTPKYQAAFNNALLDCAHGKGIAAEFQDYLPGSMLWPLRWTMTGIAAVVAALFLLLAAVRLRAAVGKR